jgi:hypothetical protein
MLNVRFSHNLNMEIAGFFACPNRQVVLVVSHLSTLYCWFSTMPWPCPFMKGKLKQLIYVLHNILICFSLADCSYIAHRERIHHLPTRAQRVTQPRWVGKWCGGPPPTVISTTHPPPHWSPLSAPWIVCTPAPISSLRGSIFGFWG